MEKGWGFCNFVIRKFIENLATSKLIGILFKLNEIPSKHSLLPMAGLDRKVYLRIPEDYKGVGALKSCIFIGVSSHPFGVAFLIEAMARDWHTQRRELSPFFVGAMCAVFDTNYL